MYPFGAPLLFLLMVNLFFFFIHCFISETFCSFVFASFHFDVAIFGVMITSSKLHHRGVNQFMRSFYVYKSRKRKNLLDLTVFLRFGISACLKAARKMLGKLHHRVGLNKYKATFFSACKIVAISYCVRLKLYLPYL